MNRDNPLFRILLILAVTINMAVFSIFFSLNLKTDWGHFVIYFTIFILIGTVVSLVWARVAKRKSLSALRGLTAVFVLTAGIWLWVAWFIMEGMKGVSGLVVSYIFPSMAIVAIVIFAILIGTKIKKKKALLYSAITLFTVQTIAFFYFACFKSEKEIVIHKAIKDGWEVTTAVEGIEKYSQLKVDINGWSRIAFALPVNHSVSRQERIPENAVFKAGIGITRGKEGYQVSLMAVEPNGNRSKLGVWYFKRDRARWENIKADLSSLGGRFATIILQVASWNPAGGKATSDSSFVFVAKPEITNVASDKMNVVVILIDTLRADRLGMYGYNRAVSTFIDSLASQSVVFTQAYSVTSWTAPTIASLFTGLTPHQHGIVAFENLPMSSDFPTLQGILSENGWWTTAVFGNPYIGHGTGFDIGFDEFAQMPISLFQYGGVRWTTEKATEKINSGIPQPFFMYVHYLDPHDPYTNSQEETPSKLTSSALARLLGFLTTTFSYADKGIGPLAYPSMRGWLNDAMQKQYDAEVYAVDDGIRKIFDALDKTGLLSNTVVIITSDHGEEFLEHGGILHGRTLYNEVIHIPLLIRLPNKENAGRKIAAPVSIAELAGTITKLADTKTQLPGRNLINLLNIADDQPVIAELVYQPDEKIRTIAVIAGDKKLIHHEDKDGKITVELYFLNEDPTERFNRAQEFPLIVQEMIKLIEPLLSTPIYNKNSPSRLNPDVLKKLKAIGYLR